MLLEGLERLLVITAHYDDLEFTAGGLVAKASESSTDVAHLLVMHSVSYVQWDGRVRSLEACQQDSIDAQAVLEYTTDVLKIGTEIEQAWPNDVHPADNMLVHMIEERVRVYQPGVVILQSPASTHPGHRNVAEASLAACRRHPRVLSVEPFAPDRRMTPFQPSLYVSLTAGQLERKCEALVAFAGSCGVTEEDVSAVQAIARHRGHEAGVKYAEAYEVHRWVV